MITLFQRSARKEKLRFSTRLLRESSLVFLLLHHPSIYCQKNTHRNQNSKYFDRSNKHSTMSRTHSATLTNLPVEIIHRIFDNLDGTEVLLSVGDVCQRLRAAVSTYHRYKLHLIALSKSDFSRLLVRIHPQHVTGLTLNDQETTPGQIVLFRSLIDIGLFNQLRSLTLTGINGEELCLFLEHVRRYSMISLTLDSRRCDGGEQRLIAEHLSSIIGQPNFLHLRLLSGDLCRLIDHAEWPAECKLQSLRMVIITKEQVSKILLHASDLETLDLGTKWVSMFDRWNDAAEISVTPHLRLTSLVITCDLDSIETILSFLSFTPCLRYLKIINTQFNWHGEHQWEELIKTELPVLNKFEFYWSFCVDPLAKETEESTLHRLISPFRTPFWTEEKRWSVRCNWFLTMNIIEIYTVPICTSHYMHRNDPTTKIASNFASEDQQSVISKDVHQLHIAPSRPELVERRVR